MIVYKPVYAPDLDTAWSKNPGAVYAMTGFVPLQRGWYGTVAKTTLFASTPSTNDVLHAAMFRQTSGSVRLLTFSPTSITEFNSAGSPTVQVSGLTTAADWSATAWGNRIIAVSLANASQTSTGTTFGALGGGSPKAAHVASNVNFVMMANVDDGSAATPDEVWWCNLGDPTAWTVTTVGSFARRNRLLDAPGAITALAAYRDQFVAFKANSIFVGTFTGQPPGIFEWKLISNRVGCAGAHAWCEGDNKLYFAHDTGIWEYDGAGLRNVSLPVFQTMLREMGRTAFYSGTGMADPPGGSTSAGRLADVRLAFDDLEGVLLATVYQHNALSNAPIAYAYAYNVRSGLWSRIGQIGNGGQNGAYPLFVNATQADLFAFFGSDVRAMVIKNNGSSFGLQYPVAADTSFLTPAFTAGNFGSINKSEYTGRAYAETMPGSTVSAFSACAFNGYTNASRNTASGGTVSAVENTAMDVWDGRVQARFATVTFTVGNGKLVLLSGVGVGDVGR